VLTSTAESISAFIKWAEVRLQEEVEENERVEAETGTREFVPGATAKRRPNNMTKDEKMALINNYISYLNQGLKHEEVQKITGLHQQSFRLWCRNYGINSWRRRKLKGRKDAL
jgi:hypothetical protein